VSWQIEQTPYRVAERKGCVNCIGILRIHHFLRHARGCTRLALIHTKPLKYVQQVLPLAEHECAIVATLENHGEILLHDASVRADKKSFDDILEFSHLLNGRTADNQVIDVNCNVASLVCIQTRSLGLEYLDRVERLFHVRVPAEWSLLETVQ
jgi:hypothetical protein